MKDSPKIKIEQTTARHIAGTGNNGREYAFDVQQVLLFKSEENWPDKAEITLPRERNGMPYEPGEYHVRPDPYVDRRGRLSMGFTLEPAA